MGNQKFKLSDMVPNAWFYKLKDMSSNNNNNNKPSSKTTKNHRLPPPPPPPETTHYPPPEPEYQPRKSYHFTRELNLPPTMEDPPLIVSPRKSRSSTKSKKSTKSKSSGCTCHSKSSPDADDSHSSFSPDSLKKAAGHFDIVIDVDNYKYNVPGSQLDSRKLLESLSTQSYKFNGLDFRLPRIITKPRNSNSTKEEKPLAPPSRRFSVSSPASGVRLKVNSPRIMARKSGGGGGGGGAAARRSVRKRRSISESFAVVKSSKDPQRDFRESMVEMIVQNNLRASKDLEDLLACYLSLNSDEYHDVIIKVFKQIWFDLSDIKHKKYVVSSQ